MLPTVATLHGETRVDEYSWLRHADDPMVRAYLQSEDEYATVGMRHTIPLRESMYRELRSRIHETDSTVPFLRGGYQYYVRTEQGRSYPIYCRRRDTANAPEDIYLDQNELAGDRPFHDIGGLDVSPDQSKVLYLEDAVAYGQWRLCVKDLTTRQTVDAVEDVGPDAVWANERTFFYCRLDQSKRAHTVWRHTVGLPRSRDVQVFQEDDPAFELHVHRSRSAAYIFIASVSAAASEWRLIPTSEPCADPVLLAARRVGVAYAVQHGGADFFIRTNEDAPNFRIVTAPESHPHCWSSWLDHRDDVFIDGFDLFERFAVVWERREGRRRLEVYDLRSNRSHTIAFSEPVHFVAPVANMTSRTDVLRFTYTSPVTPFAVYDYNMAMQTRELRKRHEVPGGFNPLRYQVDSLTIAARDGANIPVSVLRRRDRSLDGSGRLVLYAYGAYGFNVEPTFNPNVFSLVDRDIAWAVAHVRGGSELGHRWHDEGKLLKKKNGINDYIDVAESLVERGFTQPARLAAWGASAGGLLVAAAMNARPDLFRAVVAIAPFVDLVNTMLDASLPLTTLERQEWGDPREAEQYAYMRDYSPYENVRQTAYPWLLVEASLRDCRVMFCEAAKWVARLRARKTDSNPVYFKINWTGDHDGSSGRYERLRDEAFRYAFIVDALDAAHVPV